MKTAAERKRKDALKKREDADVLMDAIDAGTQEDTPANRASIKSMYDEADALDKEADEAEELDRRREAAKAARPLNRVSATAMIGGGQGQGDDDEGTDRPAAKAFVVPAQISVAPLKNFKGPTAAQDAYKFGRFLMAVFAREPKSVKFCKDHGIPLEIDREAPAEPRAAKGHNEGENAAGAVLVPQEFSPRMIDLREQFGVIRKLSYVEPMGSDSKIVPRRRGGLRAYAVGEAKAATESRAGWDRVELIARKAQVFAKYSSELNEDTIIQFGDRMMGEIAYAFSFFEDDCCFNGDGTSTYMGIVGLLTAIAAVASNKSIITASGNAWGEIVLADFIKVVGRLPKYAKPKARWICSDTFYWDVMIKVALAAGGVTAAEVVNGQAGMRFLGFPVETAQVMPDTEANSQIPVVFGDTALASTFGDRRRDSIAFSDQFAFDTDEISVRGNERFAFVAHDVGSATAAGPVVALQTAGS